MLALEMLRQRWVLIIICCLKKANKINYFFSTLPSARGYRVNLSVFDILFEKKFALYSVVALDKQQRRLI